MDVLSFSDLHLGHYLSGGDVKQEVSEYFSNKTKQLDSPAYPLKGVLGVGKLSKKFFTFLDPEEFDYDAKLMTVNGDLIDGEVDEWAKKNTLELYNQLTSNDDLDNKLIAYKIELESEFDLVADKSDVLSEIYADLHFKEELVEGSGIYSMILKELDKLGKGKKSEIAFVLGNHDLAYELFKPRFNKLGLKNVKFVDRDVMEINGFKVAGFGGSPGPGSNAYSNDELGNSQLERALEEFKKKDLKGIDVLLIHKGPNCGKVYNPNFEKVIEELVKEVSPEYLLMGHMHGGLVSGNKKYFNTLDGVIVANPGQGQFIGLDKYLDPMIINDSGKQYVKDLLKPAPVKKPQRKTQESLPQKKDRELTKDDIIKGLNDLAGDPDKLKVFVSQLINHPELLSRVRPEFLRILPPELINRFETDPIYAQHLNNNPIIQQMVAVQGLGGVPEFENPALNQNPVLNQAPVLG